MESSSRNIDDVRFASNKTRRKSVLPSLSKISSSLSNLSSKFESKTHSSKSSSPKFSSKSQSKCFDDGCFVKFSDDFTLIKYFKRSSNQKKDQEPGDVFLKCKTRNNSAEFLKCQIKKKPFFLKYRAQSNENLENTDENDSKFYDNLENYVLNSEDEFNFSQSTLNISPNSDLVYKSFSRKTKQAKDSCELDEQLKDLSDLNTIGRNYGNYKIKQRETKDSHGIDEKKDDSDIDKQNDENKHDDEQNNDNHNIIDKQQNDNHHLHELTEENKKYVNKETKDINGLLDKTIKNDNLDQQTEGNKCNTDKQTKDNYDLDTHTEDNHNVNKRKDGKCDYDPTKMNLNISEKEDETSDKICYSFEDEYIYDEDFPSLILSNQIQDDKSCDVDALIENNPNREGKEAMAQGETSVLEFKRLEDNSDENNRSDHPLSDIAECLVVSEETKPPCPPPRYHRKTGLNKINI